MKNKPIIHINANPEFFKNKKAVKALGEMVKLASKLEPKENICYKTDKPCPYDCQSLCKDSY